MCACVDLVHREARLEVDVHEHDRKSDCEDPRPGEPAGATEPARTATIVDARMQTRLLWRRQVTALGLYGRSVSGCSAEDLAARRLGPTATGSSPGDLRRGRPPALFDLTVEEVMIKYGFRYTTGERWGRLRQLYRKAMVSKILGAVIATSSSASSLRSRTGCSARDGLSIAVPDRPLLPVTYVPEAPPGPLVLAGRYDVRAHWNVLTQLLRRDRPRRRLRSSG